MLVGKDVRNFDDKDESDNDDLLDSYPAFYLGLHHDLHEENWSETERLAQSYPVSFHGGLEPGSSQSTWQANHIHDHFQITGTNIWSAQSPI